MTVKPLVFPFVGVTAVASSWTPSVALAMSAMVVVLAAVVAMVLAVLVRAAAFDDCCSNFGFLDGLISCQTFPRF